MDNCSTLRAANLARRYGKIDIYADHGIQEAELVPNLFLPSSAPECDDGVITQPEKEVAAECENNCEADDEPTDDNDDDEVRAARKFGTQQAEEDIDGAGNSPNDEDIHGAENTDNEEGMQQNGGDNGGCEDMDQAAFSEDYDSDDPPSYHTDNEDNLNDVGHHSRNSNQDLKMQLDEWASYKRSNDIGQISNSSDKGHGELQNNMAKQQGNDLGKNRLAADDVELIFAM
nr:uncharacterized protein LOC109164765 [Ipomoea batatas]